MCVIIAKPKGVYLSEAILREGFLSNPDGWGIAVIDPENAEHPVVVRKDVTPFKKFFKRYKKDESKEMLIHFRIKTHGEISQENCHPYYVTDNIWVMHNGQLNCVEIENEKMSDTFQLAKQMIKPLHEHPELLENDKFLKALGDKIGHNKLAFATPKGIVFVNSKLGIEKHGCWFSNSSAFEKSYTKFMPKWQNSYGSEWTRFSEELEDYDKEFISRANKDEYDLPEIYRTVRDMTESRLFDYIWGNSNETTALLHYFLTKYTYKELETKAVVESVTPSGHLVTAGK